MSTIGLNSPEWLKSFLREASIRRGVILYGAVRDLFFSEKEKKYMLLPELLLSELGRIEPRFSLVGRWDSADGLTFPDPKAGRRFDASLARQLGNTRPTETLAGDDYDVGEPSAPPSGRTPLTPRLAEPREMLIAWRRVMEEGHEQPALLLDWAHLLVTQPAHPAGDERGWLIQLGKAVVGEGRVSIDSDTLKATAGSLVVILAASLGAIPPALYQGDPRIALISVPAPARPERLSFLRRHQDDLRIERPRGEGVGLTSGQRDGSLELLADLTDQLKRVELRQLLALSHRTSSPLPPERLLNLYRFGEQRSPWEELSEERLEHVEEELRRRVIGQERAVEHVATMILRAWLGLAGLQHSARRSRPKGTLFFVGPTGVGKTELAKATAAFLFGDESACLRFDMSEYNHEHSDQRLVGAPPGYVGFEEGGQLTNAVRTRPFSVLLFDEVEKAHGRVLDKFLQILEDGRLTDGKGDTAWFSECVIIFTSNLGSADMPKEAKSSERRQHFLDAVEGYFVKNLGRPELLNRFGDNIVVFDPIDQPAILQGILQKKLEPLRNYMRERYGVTLVIDETLEQHYLSRSRKEHGGRGLLNALERDLLNPLSRFLFEHRHQLRKGRRLKATLEGRLPQFELEDAHGA